MKYQKVIPAKFLERPNRFIAHVEIEGQIEVAHVKNTGRCRELLVPESTVYLFCANNPTRKTKYDLIAVEKKCEDGQIRLINMDSQVVNDVAQEWLPHCGLFSSAATIRREVFYGASRFDFYVEDGERRAFVEVKGVTLESQGEACFPDAPTERGVKHIRELMECVKNGYEAYILFVVQMKGIHVVRPNDVMHQAFGDALREAAQSGVRVLAVDCEVTENSIIASSPVPVQL